MLEGEDRHAYRPFANCSREAIQMRRTEQEKSPSFHRGYELLGLDTSLKKLSIPSDALARTA